MSFGLSYSSCGLFWKAIGIVLLIFAVWNGFKLARWALTVRYALSTTQTVLITSSQPSPTGLEGVPQFGDRLGCASAPHVLGGSKSSYIIPAANANSSHTLTIRGSGVGTFVIAEAAADATDITLEMTMRTDNKALLENIKVTMPEHDFKGPITHAEIATPLFIQKACIRFDATLFVPPTVKTLGLTIYQDTHVQFHPDAQLTLDKFSVKLYSNENVTMVQTNAGIQATDMDINISRGYILGDLTVVNATRVSTWTGDAVTNVRVRPSPPPQY